MKITTNQSRITTRYRAIRLFALLLTLGWGLTPAYGQNSVEVLNISAPAHSQNGTIGSWTVPAGGPYKLRITAKGAKGGTGNSSTNGIFYSGGAGAVMSADFTASSGQVFEAVAGAPGQDFQFSTGGGGGGGASGVRFSDGTVLIVAGGGGGGGRFNNGTGPGKPALLTNTGTQGGAAGDGSGGGGLTTPGGDGNESTGGGAGYNATGGTSGGSGGGGYGAGGAGHFSGGGGGGYNGGAGGAVAVGTIGGEGGYGGGSFNDGINQTNTVDNNAGGQVIIEVLDVGVTATAMQPACANPTQGSVSLDLTGVIDGNTSDFEYAIVAGNSFTGTPAFTDLTADPFNLSSGFGTTGDADGETYTVRVRSKSGPTLFVDNTYTLTSPPQPTLRPGVFPAICAGSTSFTVPYIGTTNDPTTYSVSGTGIVTVTDAPLPGSPITVNLSSPALGGTIDFSLSVKNADGCVSTPTPATVTVNPLPTASITTNNGPICAGSDATFTVSGTSGATLTYTITGQTGNQTLTLDGTNQVITVGNATANVVLMLVSAAKDECSQNLTGTSTVTVNALPIVTPGPDQSVIFGFGSNCTDISAMATGAPTLTYSWDNGAGSDATVNVCPETTTNYTVTVTDGNGCQAQAQVKVNVQDVRCGNRDQNVTICYYGVTQCVSEKIAKRYLRLGATIGGCGTGNARIGVEESSELPLSLSLRAFPNPVQDAVMVEVLAPTAGRGTFEVLDMSGRVRQSRTEQLVEGLNEVEFRLGTLPTGIYLIRATDAHNRQGVVKVSKE